MGTVNLHFFICGMGGKEFSPNIMIWGFHHHVCKSICFSKEEQSQKTLCDIISIFKEELTELQNIELKYINISHAYIRTDIGLFSLQYDKILSEIFDDFNTDNLNIDFIYVAGGASIRCMGYRFTVHPDEEIHKNQPHVHVEKNGNQTRYSLDTLQRFENDDFCHEFQRDEKKIILPYLRANQQKLLKYWNLYRNGYLPPTEDETGKQFYAES